MHSSSPNLPAESFTPERLWKETILTKIQGLVPWAITDKLNRCGNEEIYVACADCGRFKTCHFTCNLKFCPCCNWKIARSRAQVLRAWTKRIGQPKHIVLTARNEQFITRGSIRKFQKAFAALRRSKLFRTVSGGCVSVEVTNEGRGWHLHAHVLANARWIDASLLSLKWGRLVGQDFAIVKVLDARGKDYLNEVTKYVVKGAQLASWQPEEIAQFILAIRGIRFFATFGELFNLKAEIKRELNALKPGPSICACGCCKKIVTTEGTSIMQQLRREQRK